MSPKKQEPFFKIPGEKGLQIVRDQRNAKIYDKMLGEFYQSLQAWDIYYRIKGDSNGQ